VSGTFAELWAALAIFFISHSLPSIRGIRAKFVTLLGERGFLLVYSVISLAVTTWLIIAALRAPIVELWPMTVIGIWVTAFCMVFAALLFAWGWVTPNPLSIRIRARHFNANAPGLLAVTRHPFPWSFAFWGFGHLTSNGDAGTAILFGLLAVFSVLGTKILDVRRRRELGVETWASMTAQTSSIPFAGILAGRIAAPWHAIVSLPTLMALIAYGLFLMAHQAVIGVSPLPPF
jgi:uncharacterized membrane protein